MKGAEAVKRIKKWIPAVLLIAVGILACQNAVRAAFDETAATHIDAASIENSTLAIGTHLIHLSSITEEIYQAAVKSAEESGQERQYYKSELGDGAWYDITEAAGIQSITQQGQPVADSTIESLFFQYHTKSDGVTYDLAAGKAVSVFDIPEPYQLLKMQELDPLRQHFMMLMDKQEKTSSDEFYVFIIDKFYQTSVENSTTQDCDKELAALQKYYEELEANEEEADRLQEVSVIMGEIDAKRRAEVFRILKDTALLDLMDWMMGKNCPEDILPEELMTDTDAIQAAGSALSNVEQSFIEEQGEMMQEGTTVFERKRFLYASQLIMEAQKNNYTGCDTAVEKLMYLTYIESDSIVEAKGELALLDEELIDDTQQAYQAALARGVSDEYRAGVSNQSSAALLRQLLKNQKSDTNVCRLELQKVIQAQTDRMEPAAAKEYITQRIEQLGSFEDIMVADAFKSYGLETVEEHREWLISLLTALTAQTGGSELDALAAQKEALQEERLACLDKNDLAGARKLQAQISAKDEEIAEQENKLNAILQADSSTPAQKALAQSNLGSNTATSALQELKNDTMADIRSGDFGGLENSLESISQMYEWNPEAAKNALTQIYKELTARQMQEESEGAGADGAISGESTGSKSEIEEYLDEITDIMSEHMTTGDKLLSEQELYACIAKVLGADFEGLSNQDKTSALIAVNWYADYTQNADMQHIAGNMAKKLYQEQVFYVYQRILSTVQEYAPVDALGKCIGYRYIFDDTEKQATLQKGKRFYQFRSGSKKVLREDDKEQEMEQAAKYQSLIYLEETFLYDSFQCQIEYVIQTDYGVLATEKMMTQAEALFEAMLAEGGN